MVNKEVNDFYCGYMDYNSSVPMPLAVRERVGLSLMRDFGNGSSVHRVGRGLSLRINEVRDQIADFIGCRSEEIIFTSGATEANNLLLRESDVDRILVGVDGHESLIQPSLRLSHDKDCRFIGLHKDGTLDLGSLENELSKGGEGKTLVALTLANSETGVLQDVSVVSRLVKSYGGWLHFDAVQSLGTLSVDVEKEGIDSLSFSGHKIGAMPGIGVLYISEKKRPKLQALLAGGGQERGTRSGSYNVPAIVSLGAAIDWLQHKKATNENQRLQNLKDHLEKELKKIDPEIQIVGEKARRLAHVSSIIMIRLDSQGWLIEMDLSEIYISSGSACASGKVGDSKTLKAMGFDLPSRKRFIRVSLGWASRAEDIENFLAVVNRVYAREG